MIYSNGNAISGVFSGSQRIIAVYKGLQLVWDKFNTDLACCFSNGYWMDEYPWIDDSPWVD